MSRNTRPFISGDSVDTKRHRALAKEENAASHIIGLDSLLLRLANLFDIKNLSYERINDQITSTINQLTGSSWCELLLLQKNKLKVYGSNQAIQFLDINDESLPGLVALNKLSQFVNHASTSSFYQAFKYKLNMYSSHAGVPIQPSTILCVPVLDEEGELYAVVQVFNKLNEYTAVIPFTIADVHTINSIGNILIKVLKSLKTFQSLQKKTKAVKEDMEEILSSATKANFLIRQRFISSACCKILRQEKKVNKHVIQMISDALDGDAIILHLIEEGAIKPIISYGFPATSRAELTTKTSEYCAFNRTEILNIEDLSSEPLWDKPLYKMKCLLTYPITNSEGKLSGVLEIFRKERTFNSIDEKICSTIIEAMREIPFNSNNFTDEYGRGSDVKTQIMNQNRFENIMRKFDSLQFEPSDMIDYVRLLKDNTECIQRLVKLNSCTIYLADLSRNTIWTQKSQSCDALVYPVVNETILGHTLINRKLVSLPSDNEMIFSDVHEFDGQYVLSIPILGDIVPTISLGVILLTRPEKPFKELEIARVTSLCKSLAHSIETLYLIKLPDVKFDKQEIVIEEHKQPVNAERFRKLNIRKRSSMEMKKEYFLYERNALQSGPRLSTKWDTPELISNLFSLADLSMNRFQDLKLFLREIKNNPQDSLRTLSIRMNKLIPCERAKLLIADDKNEHLIDFATSTLYTHRGLVKKSLDNRVPINITSNASNAPAFDRHIDGLGFEKEVRTYMCVPIINIDGEPVGALVFINSSLNFTEDDVALAQFLALIPRDFNQSCEQSDMQSILKAGRRHRMLVQWCRQVFTVAISAQSNHIIAKDMLYRIQNQNTLESMLQATLEIICALTNSEHTSIIFNEGNNIMEFTKDSGRISKSFEEFDEDLFIMALEENKPVTMSGLTLMENIMMAPYKQAGSQDYIVIQIIDKRDETLSYFCNFTREDEILCTRFGKYLYEAMHGNAKERDYDEFKEYLKEQAENINIYTLIKTIRNAAQKMLDSDRATVFIREKDYLVVKAQGLEQEIPANFSIPIGKGIVGNVAQTGQCENIHDVYRDSRFNPELDKRTGYKTTSMLCMPVINFKGEVIAAIQMINKRQGVFDKNDEETLEVFCEIIAVVLHNWIVFSQTNEERSQLMAILDSIGNYVFVFNSDGMLQYRNKSVEEIFGISEKIAIENHYSGWLRANRQLVYDLTTVYQNPASKISRQYQQLVSVPLLRKSSTLSKLRNLNQIEKKTRTCNYSVSPLLSFGTSKSCGVVLIMEDIKIIQEVSSKVQEIESKIKSWENPIKMETSLQKCIATLRNLLNHMDISSEPYTQLREVINTLKHGNLTKPTISIATEFNQLANEVRNTVKIFCKEDVEFSDPRSSPTVVFKRAPNLDHIRDASPNSDLEELRNWSLNAYEYEHKDRYIGAILKDFDLMNQFGIEVEKLRNFIEAVDNHYSSYDNPFHNFHHGFSVMHSLYLLLAGTQAHSIFNAHHTLALLIAALCHDIEHTGRTNAFEINRESNLSLIYNDRAPLENHHAAMTFKILQQDRCNIFENIPNDTKKGMRKVIIHSILGTDMSRHFIMITHITTRLQYIHEQPVGSLEKDVEDISEFLLHCCDLAHPTKNIKVYKQWSERVCAEYSRQYKEELSLGLTPTAFMKDLDVPKVYYKNELSFLSVVAKPLWKCLELWLNSSIQESLENLEYNIAYYQERLKELEESKADT